MNRCRMMIIQQDNSNGKNEREKKDFSRYRSSLNSRTNSMAESTTEGFSNYTEIIQHLQTSNNPSYLCPWSFLSLSLVWNHHNNMPENTRRTATDDPIPSSSSSHSKAPSHYHHPQQGHYSHHQNWSNYNNPRRSGGNPNYSRGYNDGYWNGKSSRFPVHRSVNSLMNNSNNYQQQSSQPSPPTQRRPNDLQQQYENQTYYKSTHHSFSFICLCMCVCFLRRSSSKWLSFSTFHRFNK